MHMEKEYRVFLRSEMYVDVYAEDEIEAQELAYDKLHEDSKRFLRGACVNNIREIK